MGVDIDGVVEYRADGGWHLAARLGKAYQGRDYDLFGWLFGVRNHTGFEPMAAGRGVPDDLAAESLRLRDPETYAATWVSLPELEAVDWDEAAPEVDARVHQYVRGPEGEWRYATKSAWNRDLAEHAGVDSTNAQEFPEGSEWEVGERLFRVERLTRRCAGGAEWAPVVALMQAIRGQNDGADVRLVVWFDQ
jgi:hypothetical protein